MPHWGGSSRTVSRAGPLQQLCVGAPPGRPDGPMRSFAAVDPLKTKFDAMDTQGMINEERCSGVPFHWIYHKIHVCFQEAEEQNMFIC